LAAEKNSQELTCHRRLPVSIFSVEIAALGSLKRVTGRIVKKLVISREQTKTLSLIFSSAVGRKKN
jgi:hypothetical protein